jgi:Chaperone of endosialidase
MKKKTLQLRNSLNRLHVSFAFVLILLAYFALSPTVRAVCQEGCLTNGNTALGSDALLNNTTGTGNTAIGTGALTFNTTGFNNTATGQSALTFNKHGYNNTAIGVGSLNMNTEGNSNTAVGGALGGNTAGSANTAVGVGALADNSTGNDNTALGFLAGHNLTGDNNIALGFLAGQYPTTGDNNIDIGNQGGADDSGFIRIGTTGMQTATFVAGIRGVPITGAQQVGVNASGQLGIRASSARFKEAINSMDKSSEAILALCPVEFRYKKELDPKGAPQFGLIAEEVAKVNPHLVVADDQGKPFSVRYEEVNAMLLNEFLKEHRTVQEQGATIARQQKQIEALTAGLQRVSAQLEMSKSAPRTVSNNH